jgi:hypothetical protein
LKRGTTEEAEEIRKLPNEQPGAGKSGRQKKLAATHYQEQ